MTNDRCIVTFATGPAEDCGRHTVGPMRAYADRHGYDLIKPEEVELDPPSWGKVPLLISSLEKYDAALWLDADVLILDGGDDVAAEVPGTAVQAMVAHKVRPDHAPDVQPSADGWAYVPNCGVWYLTRAAIPMLRSALEMYQEHRNHCWWEQAAIIRLISLGWGDRTHFLDNRWNRHPLDVTDGGQFKFLHATMVEDRPGLLKMMSGYAR